MKTNRKGFTAAEVAVAIGVGATIAVVSAALFKAAIKTYAYTVRQNAALTAASALYKGRGSKMGLITTARQSSAVASLDTTAVSFLSTGSVTTSFSISTGTLVQNYNGTKTVLANDASALTIGYYNINSATGLIFQSTVASYATFVTAQLKVSGLTNTQKTYYFYSGAQIRNHN